MTRRRTPCPTCDRPVTAGTLCRTCTTNLERSLGDIGALHALAERIWTTDTTRSRGDEKHPLVTSRRRGTVKNPKTGDTQPEAFRAGEYGRTSPIPWDTDAGLGRDLDATVARQRVLGEGPGARTADRPLPYNSRAADTDRETVRRLDHWVRVLHRTDEPWPVAHLAAQSRWLLARIDRAATHPAAGELDRDVARVVAQLRRVVDRPADRWYAGPCDVAGCVEEHLSFDDDGRMRRENRPTSLWADPESDHVVCRRCGTRYDVEERRAWLLAEAEDQLCHAELIGRAAPALGVDITPAAIRGYAARGRIVAHSTDWQGRPLYRVGDVIDVARDVLARRAEAKAKAEERREKQAKRRSA